MAYHSSSRSELEERRDRMLYNSDLINYFLNVFKSELECTPLPDFDGLPPPATRHEEVMDFLAQLTNLVRYRLSADSSLGYLDLLAPGEQAQGIKKLSMHIAWLERLLRFIQLEVKLLDDALYCLDEAEQVPCNHCQDSAPAT